MFVFNKLNSTLSFLTPAGGKLGGSIELVMLSPLFKLLIRCISVDICQCKFDTGKERIQPGAVD